ncbi:hypothetical protein HS1genome_1958 [Sulfodiicoccus acidiphilus]|uniref:ArnR1-like winged helix-turn-helix domain-containing protein n=1 Tax=Sulfodiicoccus acidiphilus TaxID=1670455 RepID=A0A348B5W7_9CREN|nr:winged helix-turn-helix domain-containing protein [Sulfodiicoccus acidiphilus]BBD73569.1 hypothetical protein HS1genome_1958 [Sulfodiicoccus acidiphilus]GGU01795.1 hypothetical protein GCM10007116_18730 [Sulfodiicoccus acidiphilus]
MARKRNRVEIYGDVLNACSSGLRKTPLMYRTNLSYVLLRRYLKEMKERGLLYENGGLVYPTDKGRKLLLLIRRSLELKKEIEEVELKLGELRTMRAASRRSV